MSEQGSFAPHDNPFRDALRGVYGDLFPVEESFALLPDVERFGSDVVELYSDRLRERIIAFEADSPIMAVHNELQEKGIHVLDKMIINDTAVLPVPKSIRSIRSVAGLIQDAYSEQYDTEQYMPVFQELGKQLRALHDADLGMPSGNWLEQFAFSSGAGEAHGPRVLFLPPYNRSDSLELTGNVSGRVGSQLLDVYGPVRDESIANQLAQEVHNGWRKR